MTAKPPLRDEEVARILGLLEPLSDDRSIVLVGGQAVTFWTRLLERGWGACADGEQGLDSEGARCPDAPTLGRGAFPAKDRRT